MNRIAYEMGLAGYNFRMEGEDNVRGMDSRTPENEHGDLPRRHGALLPVVVLLFVAAVIFLVFLFYQTPNETSSEERAITGTVFMTASLAPGGGLLPIAVDLESGRVFSAGDDIAGRQATIFHSISRGERYEAFLGGEEGSREPQLYIVEYDTSDPFPSIDGLSSVEGTPAGATLRALSVSDSGRVVYMSLLGERGSEVFTDTNSWDIRMASDEGGDVLLTGGAYPSWIDEDLFVFLKNDGLYIYDTRDLSERRVWGIDRGVALTNMKIGLSPEGQSVAWSVPHEGKVYILDISGAVNGIGAQVTNVIDATAFWAVFSPDGRFLALQTADAAQNARLDVYDTEEFKQRATLGLGDVNTASVFVTDWQ